MNAGELQQVSEAAGGLVGTGDELGQNLAPSFEQLGSFDAYGGAASGHAADKDGKEYVTVVQQASYQQGSAQFTVSFYEDGSLCGLYMKQTK